jgi:hypothetical protein
MEVSGHLHAPAAFTPRERAPGTRWIGVSVGPSETLVPQQYTALQPRRTRLILALFYSFLQFIQIRAEKES